jgi:hypothetical protein
MSGAGADSAGEGLETLAYRHYQRAADWRAIYPLALSVLGLKTFDFACLKEIASEHAVFVRPDTLAHARAVVGVFDDFQLVLLVFVEELVESCGG